MIAGTITDFEEASSLVLAQALQEEDDKLFATEMRSEQDKPTAFESKTIDRPTPLPRPTTSDDTVPPPDETYIDRLLPPRAATVQSTLGYERTESELTSFSLPHAMNPDAPSLRSAYQAPSPMFAPDSPSSPMFVPDSPKRQSPEVAKVSLRDLCARAALKRKVCSDTEM